MRYSLKEGEIRWETATIRPLRDGDGGGCPSSDGEELERDRKRILPILVR